jgi:hypothetical protein
MYIPSFIKSIAHGKITIADGVASNTQGGYPNNSNTIVMFLGCGSQGVGTPNMQDMSSYVTISGGTVTAARDSGSMSQPVDVYYAVIEFYPFFVKSIQAISIDCSSSKTQTVTAVGSKAVIFYGGFSLSSASNAPDSIGGLTLTSSTVVTAGPRDTNMLIKGSLVDFR